MVRIERGVITAIASHEPTHRLKFFRLLVLSAGSYAAPIN
jgi:hypothetical protein